MVEEKSAEERGKLILIHLTSYLWGVFAKQKIITIDSNHFHFIIYQVIQTQEELKKLIPCGWFYHGPYIPWLDDVLVEKFGMDKKYHQLEGDEKFNREICETEYEGEIK